LLRWWNYHKVSIQNKEDFKSKVFKYTGKKACWNPKKQGWYVKKSCYDILKNLSKEEFPYDLL